MIVDFPHGIVTLYSGVSGGGASSRVYVHPHPSSTSETLENMPSAAPKVQDGIGWLNVVVKLSSLELPSELRVLVLPIEISGARSTLIVVGFRRRILHHVHFLWRFYGVHLEIIANHCSAPSNELNLMPQETRHFREAQIHKSTGGDRSGRCGKSQRGVCGCRFVPIPDTELAAPARIGSFRADQRHRQEWTGDRSGRRRSIQGCRPAGNRLPVFPWRRSPAPRRVGSRTITMARRKKQPARCTRGVVPAKTQTGYAPHSSPWSRFVLRPTDSTVHLRSATACNPEVGWPPAKP